MGSEKGKVMVDPKGSFQQSRQTSIASFAKGCGRGVVISLKLVRLPEIAGKVNSLRNLKI